MLVMKNIEAGIVNWETLKEDLMELSKEQLVDLVDVWIKNYWSCQSYWMTFVERDFGEEVAGRLDSEVFEQTARIQAYRLKRLLNLGDDMQALAFALKHSALQWAPAGFDWEFVEVTDTEIKMRVRQCPMGVYRKEHNLELYPCKHISPPLYTALAKAINPKMVAYCTHAHPDAPKEGVMCEWHFVYES